MTIHQHGGHQASTDDGQPTRYLIRHGQSRTYDFPLRDGGQAAAGRAALLPRPPDGPDRAQQLVRAPGHVPDHRPARRRGGCPHGRFDLPLMVTDRSFRPTTGCRTRSTRHVDADAPRRGSRRARRGARTGHGTASGTVGTRCWSTAGSRRTRRCSPAATGSRSSTPRSFSSYDFALSDGRPFVQIGTGSGLLPHPVTRQDILLGPAQRADVVVDFRGEAGKNVVLSSIKRTDGSTTGIGSREAASCSSGCAARRTRRRGSRPARPTSGRSRSRARSP